jgi:hypothetical protein
VAEFRHNGELDLCSIAVLSDGQTSVVTSTRQGDVSPGQGGLAMAGRKTIDRVPCTQGPPEGVHRWRRIVALAATVMALGGTASTASAVYVWQPSCVPKPGQMNLPDPPTSCVGGGGLSPTQPTFAIQASATKLSIQHGSSGTTTLTVMPINGFSGTVTMAVAPATDSPVTNAPPTTAFSNGAPAIQSSSPYTGQVLTVSTSLNTPPGQYHYTVQAESPQANPAYVWGDIFVQVRTAPGLDDTSSCPASGCHFVNHGTVLANPRVFLIFWGSLWSQDTDGTIPTLTHLMQQASGTNWWSKSSEYGIGSMTLGDVFVDTTNDNNLNAPIGEPAIDSEVLSVVSRRGWTMGGNDIYYVIPEVGYPISGGGPESCGFHNFHYSPNYAYAALANFRTPGYSGCITSGVSSAESEIAAHELVEAATDPRIGQGIYDAQNGEIADPCVLEYNDTLLPGQQLLTASGFYSQKNQYCAAEKAGGAFVSQANGCVSSYGDAPAPSNPNCGAKLNAPMVGVAATPSGGGYWLVGSDGGVFTVNAPFYGSQGGVRLNASVVGIAGTPDGHGYWLVAADGGVFTFGNAGFYGSMGGKQLNKPVSGMAPTPDGQGYWLVAQDGGIFSFGDATFKGNGLNAPQPCYRTPTWVGINSSPSGGGYEMFNNDGMLVNEGAQYMSQVFCAATNGVGVASHFDSRGDDGIDSKGGVIPFGDGGISYVGPTYNSPVTGLATIQ